MNDNLPGPPFADLHDSSQIGTGGQDQEAQSAAGEDQNGTESGIHALDSASEGPVVKESLTTRTVAGVVQSRFTRLTSSGWVLVGTTCPPDDSQPEVVNRGCSVCDKALDSLCMEQVLRLSGIHCTYCGQLRRATV